MKPFEKNRKLLLVGIIGCLLYVIGDFLYAATGKSQTTETIGMFTKIAYLDMATWRMWASIVRVVKSPCDGAEGPDLGQAVSHSLYHGNRGLGVGSRYVHDKCADLQVRF